MKRQANTSEYIFPYNPRSICAAFTRACRVLGIVDLRFHDLRHEATSRLFERGYHIHEVAQFTPHESWNESRRYTNLRPEKLREIPQETTEPVYQMKVGVFSRIFPASVRSGSFEQ